MKLFDINHTVKVTHESETNINDIGYITAIMNPGFVEVEFGSYIKVHNVNSLVDITYGLFYDN